MSSGDYYPDSVYYNTEKMTEQQLYEKFREEGFTHDVATKLARGQRIGSNGGRRSRRRRTGRRRRRTGRRRK